MSDFFSPSLLSPFFISFLGLGIFLWLVPVIFLPVWSWHPQCFFPTPSIHLTCLIALIFPPVFDWSHLHFCPFCVWSQPLCLGWHWYQCYQCLDCSVWRSASFVSRFIYYYPDVLTAYTHTLHSELGEAGNQLHCSPCWLQLGHYIEESSMLFMSYLSYYCEWEKNQLLHADVIRATQNDSQSTHNTVVV